jgi:origin recognition complex subunit 1
MKLPKVEDGYQVLCEHFLGIAEASWKKSHKLLDEYFKSPNLNKKVTVLIVDEMDNLVTSNQTFLYNLFEWPSNKNAHLVCIAIANIMDLPEKLLPKINSRLGLGRVTFSAYQRDQIEKIIKTRLEGLDNVFDKDAIEMCARKVASLSGDVRKALQLSRRAIEVCKKNNAVQVTIPHVNQAFKEINSRMASSYVAQTGILEKLILIALHKYLHLKQKNLEDFVKFKTFYYQLEMETKQKVNFERITMQEVLMVCKRMQKLGLIVLQGSDLGRDEEIQCSVEIDDLKRSLQDTDLLETINHL